MALIKTTSASASYIVSPNSTATTFTPGVEASVFDGKLIPGDRITKPGVFTAGTTPEGSISQIESNS